MAVENIAENQDDDIFDLTDIVNPDDDILDLSEQDKAGSASAPPPPPVPANAQEAEDMDLDNLLSQLESGEDLKDENYGLPQSEPEPEPEPVAPVSKPDTDFDMDLDFGKPSDDDDFGDITAAINQKREAFDADLDLDLDFGSPEDEKSGGSNSVEDDLDDLLAGLGGSTSAPDPKDDHRESDKMLDEMGDLDFGSDMDDDPFDDVDSILNDLNLDDLDGLDSIPAPAPKKDPVDDFDLDGLDFEAAGEELASAAKPKVEDDDPFADIDDLLNDSDAAGKSKNGDDDLDSLLGEFNEMNLNPDSAEDPIIEEEPAQEVQEVNKDEIDVDFPDDLDDFIKDTDAVLEPIIDESILDIGTDEGAESIEFTEDAAQIEEDIEAIDEAIEENEIIEDAGISSYAEEFDVLPNQDEQILIVEDEPSPAPQAVSSPAQVAMPQVVQNTLSGFDNTNNQSQFNLLFAEFRLLSSEIADLKRREKTGDKDILLPIVGKELNCKDIEENLASLRTKLMGFGNSLSTMQEDAQNVASELAVDAEGEERSSIDNFIMEMSESFDNFSKSLSSFDNKLSEMEKANTEMETSMTVLRTKVEKNAAKIDLLSTRLDNLDASFANMENLVATTAARIIREELAALLAEEDGGAVSAPQSEPIVQDVPVQTTPEPIVEENFEMPAEVEMPAEEIVAEQAEVNFDEMLDAPIETVANPDPIADIMEQAPVETAAVAEELDPFEAMSAEVDTAETTDAGADIAAEMGIEMNASEAIANAVPEEFDMDALFDTEAK